MAHVGHATRRCSPQHHGWLPSVLGIPAHPGRWLMIRLPVLLSVVLVAVGLLSVPPAAADGPGAGSPWVVSLGDSAISGEAGRWAGNTNNCSSLIDAGGANAYWDNATRTAEAIPGCHRSESAAIHIGG